MATQEIAGGLVRNITTSVAAGISEPVSFLDLINFTHTDEEMGQELQAIAKGVRETLERDLELALVVQTITVDYDGPADELRLPRIPFVSLTTVKERLQGVLQADIASQYYVIGDRLRRTDAAALISGATLQVVYQAGYTAAPEDIKHQIKVLSSTRFDLREETVEGKVARQIPGAGLDALRHYRRYY